MEIDLTFKTYDEFEAYRAQWERDTQQVFVKAKSRKFEHGVKERDTIVYKAVTFACVHGKDRPSESDGDRPFQHTKKKGCPVVFQLMGSKKSGTLSVRIAPDISQHSHTLTETCQRQVKLNCGIHAIAMAVSFAMGEDPSAARYSHELMRNHLRQCFENKRLDKFPLPKAKDRITLIQHKAPTNFKIPKLWHKLDGKSPTKPKTAKKFKKP